MFPESLWSLVQFTVGYLKKMARDFSALICREIESSHQENLTKSRHIQISPNILGFFHDVPDKGFVRVKLGGGRVLHELYLTCRHFWEILYKRPAGVSSTSTGVIYAFITPTPASKSCHSCTSFSKQIVQVNFLPLYHFTPITRS